MSGIDTNLMLLRRWLLIMLLACCAPLAHADAPSCAQQMGELDAKKLDGMVIRIAQQQLVQLGYHPDGIDGVLGARTRLALALFCADARFAVSDDLLATLHDHVEIVQAYPDWRETLSSRDFSKWMHGQEDAAEIVRVRDFGDAAEVEALLARYAARSNAAPQPRSGKDVAISYGLTADDFTQLRSREKVLEQFGKLLGATYAGRNEFEAAAEDALKGVPNYQRYIDLAESYGRQQTGYRISAESFKQLKSANVPDCVLQAIQDIQDTSFPDGALKATINATLGKLSERVMSMRPDLVRLAEISTSGASLTAASLAAFAGERKDDALAAPVLARLQKLQGMKYRNDKELARKMQAELAAVVAEIEDSRDIILAHAGIASGYGFGIVQVQQIEKALQAEIVPAPCLDMISSVEGADYPTPDLFGYAVHSRLRMDGTNNIYRLAVFEQIDNSGIVKLEQKALDALKDKKVPAAVIEGLVPLKDRKFGSNAELREAVGKQVDAIGKALDEKYGGYADLLVEQARKSHPYQGTAIEWNGQACSCVHDNLAGQVYGFYPYWQAGGEQAIDFSVLTRVDYFGVGFDDDGKILQPERWSNADTGFIREARKYGSKVDLVVYRHDWNSWGRLSAEKKLEAFKKLAVQIYGQLVLPLDDFASRAKPYVSLGTHPPPIRGDGVTLYFDGYPGDPESVDAFTAFLRELGALLARDRHAYAVNLMFRSSDIGSGIYGYGKLIELMDGIRGSGKRIDGKLLVLLQESTTYDKKNLRSKIEDSLHGRDRMKLLRDVAMVVSYDGISQSQLTDDVIYANDNFGGIGFWPQPVAVKKNAAAADGDVSRELHRDYQRADGNFAAALGICRYVCPNRWMFRLAWDGWALLMLAAAVLYARNCTWRGRFEANFIRVVLLLVVPFVGLTFALLFCDPAWKSLAGDYSLPILMVAVMIGYSIWNYREKKRKANLP